MINNNILEQEKTTNKVAPKNSRITADTLFKIILLNWKWFFLSVVIAIGLTVLALRYITPRYIATGNLLLKVSSNVLTPNTIKYSKNLGTVTETSNLENEIEILKTRSLATEVVRDLKLYTIYKSKGRIKEGLIYNTSPIIVDIDPQHLEKLNVPIKLSICRENGKYVVNGTYYVPLSETKAEGPFSINKTLTSLPATITTRAGILTFTSKGGAPLPANTVIDITISSPKNVAAAFWASTRILQTNPMTSILEVDLEDAIPQRAKDYIRQLVICYNRQANEDKNEVALRTEEFINSRIEKINAELGDTEGALERYKKANRVINMAANADLAMNNTDQYQKELVTTNTQVSLLNSLSEYINAPQNKYQVLPSNVGLTDESTAMLINKYNEVVLERNRILKSASENSPTITPLTAQLDEMSASIKQSMIQARKNMEIKRSSIMSQVGKYTSMIQQSPEQERVLNQIGRQQDVKSGLYLMLLQKREENSISLAATADKGKLMDEPVIKGKVSPNTKVFFIVAILLGLLIPFTILLLIELLRYKIEGHEDVEKLSVLPILADIPIANEAIKTKGEIVIHENVNNQMAEIFRGLRTNLQFMLSGNQKVIMFTSSISGEGKTFIASNLAISFALLGKKVVLMGLDIRKPRLEELLQIDNKRHGITNLLAMDNITEAEIAKQMMPSGINNNLDLLLAGPIPPNPTELLNKQSLDKVVDMLKKDYDYIIIDTAPVGLVTDTLLIGRVVDITMLICRADYTPKDNLFLFNTLHAENKLPKMCLAINGIDMSKKKYGYYYGYGRYGRYGKYGKYGKYGNYGNYSNSHYADKNDNSIKKK